MKKCLGFPKETGN